MNTNLKIYFLFLILAIFSCRENTNSNDISIPDTTNSNFALILCEGLWGYNNSTVSKLNLIKFDVQNDFTSIVNKNFKIGDIGNDIALKGDTFFVVATTSKALEYFDVQDGKLLGYFAFEGNSAPRHLAVINDSIVSITDLYKDCVYILNISSKKIEKTILVGPAPEFVEYFNGQLYVANSGYGDYRASEPKAGTLSIVDVNAGKEVANLFVAPNPIEIAIDGNRHRLFVSYNHLPSLKDSVGGIVLFDLLTLQRVKEWKFPFPRSLQIENETGKLFFLSGERVWSLNVDNNELEELIVNPKPSEIWYSICVDTKNKYILVGNAKNYTVEGEVIIFDWNDKNATFKHKVTVGVNPSQILIKN